MWLSRRRSVQIEEKQPPLDNPELFHSVAGDGDIPGATKIDRPGYSSAWCVLCFRFGAWPDEAKLRMSAQNTLLFHIADWRLAGNRPGGTVTHEGM